MDSEIITEKINSLGEDSKQLEEILSKVVAEYTSELDRIMGEIDLEILQTASPSIKVVEHYFLELSSHLYFMCEKVERLGVYDSLSKSKAQEVYNQSYLRHQYDEKLIKKKPTVAELSALSEADALYDKTINDLYSRAYKTVKNKVASAETMVSTLSKIFSHRIQEAQLSGTQMSRQILNEGVMF